MPAFILSFLWRLIEWRLIAGRPQRHSRHVCPRAMALRPMQCFMAPRMLIDSVLPSVSQPYACGRPLVNTKPIIIRIFRSDIGSPALWLPSG
jgi:hypothetical protein